MPAIQKIMDEPMSNKKQKPAEALAPQAPAAQPTAPAKKVRESVTDSLDMVTHYQVHKAAGRRPLFKGKDFNGLVAVGKEFQAADFTDCSFDGATFVNCNMQGWVLTACEGAPTLTDCDTRFSVGL